MLPEDPAILLCFVNMKLRDEYEDLPDLCAALDIKENYLTDKLASVGYRYDPVTRQFI